MNSDRLSRNRGISPVVGVVLTVAVVLVLASLSAGMVFSLVQEREPAPEVTMSLETGESGIEHVIIHENGDVLDGDNVEVRGVANPEGVGGQDLAAGERHPVVATDSDISVVWFGEHGTSYTLAEFDVPEEETLPEPDKGCPWVDSESNGGTDDVKVDGIVVDCDVVTDKVIEVQNGGAIIGDTESVLKEVDADDARLYGDVTVDDNLNVQDGLVAGSVASDDLAKVDNSSVWGSVETVDTVEVISGSSVEGDVVSETGLVKVLSSDVSGAVVTDGSVKLQDATVSGHVFVDSGDFDCTDSTIRGQDCDEYSPRDPDEY